MTLLLFFDAYIQEQSPFKKKRKYDFSGLEDPECAAESPQATPSPLA